MQCWMFLAHAPVVPPDSRLMRDLQTEVKPLERKAATKRKVSATLFFKL